MNGFPKHKAGQAILFLLVVLLIGSVVVIWNFNLHRSVITKMRLRDAGDGAALAGARWQGISLNMVGELNLFQAALVADTLANGLGGGDEVFASEEEEVRAVLASELAELDELRRRIAVNGPLIGFSAAQQMALNNRVHANTSYSSFYTSISGDFDMNTVGDDFMMLLQSIADNGIAARTVTVNDGHILYDAGFYQAIQQAYTANDWCAFYNHPSYKFYLESYDSPDVFFPLPDTSFSILGLDVINAYGSLGAILNNLTNSVPDVGELQEAIDEIRPGIDLGALQDIDLKWVVFGSSWNFSWQQFADSMNLPFREDFLPQYDYMGPESIFEISIDFNETKGGANRLVGYDHGSETVTNWFNFEANKAQPGQRSTSRGMRWVAAAKTFGSIDNGSGGAPYTPNYFGLVLPVFSDARLIPVQRNVHDAGVDPNHDFVHLVHYEDDGMIGIDANSDGSSDYRCIACQSLIWLDDVAFRQRGIEWLNDPDKTQYCFPPGGGGGGGGSGGAPFGH